MNWILLALIGTGAYFFGRYDERTNKLPVPKPPADAPTPPLPSVTDLNRSAASLPPTYAQAWDDALQHYDIDVYPPEAAPHVDRLLPPPQVDGISVAPSCLAVAVGEDWWIAMKQYAQTFIDRGMVPDAVARNTLKYMAPTCVNKTSPAALGLRQAVLDQLSQQRNGTMSQDEEILLTRS